MDWQVLEERVRGLDGMVSSVADAQYVWSRVYVDAMVLRDRNADGDGSTGSGGLEERIYALQDGNWNTTALIVASGVPGASVGDILQRFVYTPFGEVDIRNADWSAAAGAAAAWQHLFQGLKFSDVTGLAYVRNRDYSASLGRFIELDPIGFNAGDNNWYRFVGNGPLGRVDPSGLWSWWPWHKPSTPPAPLPIPIPPPTAPPATPAAAAAGKICAEQFWLETVKRTGSKKAACELLWKLLRTAKTNIQANYYAAAIAAGGCGT
jgi:RHS repeat-associated protein